MARLNFAKRSVLLALIVLFSLATTSHLLYQHLSKEIHTYEQQLAGIEMLSYLFRSIQAIQQYRGLTAGVLEGNNELQGLLQEEQKQAKSYLLKLKQVLPTDYIQASIWQAIESQWEFITTQGKNTSATENFKLQTRLIDELFTLLQLIKDDFHLNSSGDLDHYYLMNTALNQLAPAQEFLGQTRAAGVAILFKKHSSEIQRHGIYALLLQADYSIKQLSQDLKKTIDYNPLIQKALSPFVQKIDDNTKEFNQLVTEHILNHRYDIEASRYFHLTTAIINTNYKVLYDVLLPTIKNLTETQLHKVRVTLQQAAIIISLFFILFLYFAIGTYLAMQKNIRSISNNAVALAKGNLNQRISINSNNELSLLGDSFNYMAEQLSQLLQEEQKVRARAEAIVNSSHEGITITDSKGVIIDVNPAFSKLTGYQKEEVIGNNPSILSSGKQGSEFYQHMWNCIDKEGLWSGEVSNKKKNGELFVAYLTITAITDPSKNDTLLYVGMLSDITESRKQQKNLELMAHYDVLTQLPNRALFSDRFSLAIAHSKRNNSLLAICFLDLDNFKPINDNYGHNVGDKLLIEVANRISASIRDEDTVSRQGGDEFALLLGDIDSIEQCQEILERIHYSLSQPFFIDGLSHQISASSGVTLYPDDNADIDTLIRHADQAMYQSKLAGKHQYQLFNTQLDKQTIQEYHRREEIQAALVNNELCLYFQPKVNIKTGHVFGAEALIRWIHPQKGLIPPLSFLPIIDGTEIEIHIGEWVINQALKQLNLWNKQGIQLEVSINISSYHLQSTLFMDYLEKSLAQYPEVISKYLQLEILESSALGDLPTISHIIQTCQNKLGVHIALDDFGTGYSSLTHLRNLSANTIKIDQSFVRDMLDDPSDYAIIDGVIGLSHAFNQSVIAEGVETTEHGLMLYLMGCYAMQGYGISRPMPSEDFPNWLLNYTPNSVWQNYTKQTYNSRERKVEIFKLITQQWLGCFEKNIQQEYEPSLVWPISNHNKCPCGTWIKREKQEALFAVPLLSKLQALHDQAHKLSNTLVIQHQNNKIGNKEVQALRKLFREMNALLG